MASQPRCAASWCQQISRTGRSPCPAAGKQRQGQQGQVITTVRPVRCPATTSLRLCVGALPPPVPSIRRQVGTRHAGNAALAALAPARTSSSSSSTASSFFSSAAAAPPAAGAAPPAAGAPPPADEQARGALSAAGEQADRAALDGGRCYARLYASTLLQCRAAC